MYTYWFPLFNLNAAVSRVDGENWKPLSSILIGYPLLWWCCAWTLYTCTDIPSSIPVYISHFNPKYRICVFSVSVSHNGSFLGLPFQSSHSFPMHLKLPLFLICSQNYFPIHFISDFFAQAGCSRNLLCFLRLECNWNA